MTRFSTASGETWNAWGNIYKHSHLSAVLKVSDEGERIAFFNHINIHFFCEITRVIQLSFFHSSETLFTSSTCNSSLWPTGFPQCHNSWNKSQRIKTASYFSFLLSYVSSSSVSLLFLFPPVCLSQSASELKQEHRRYLKFEERHYYDFSLKGQVKPQAW